MTRLSWDIEEASPIALDRGVFFPQNRPAEAWNGLVSVEPKLVESRTRYQDGVKLDRPNRGGIFSATLLAFTHPPSFPPRNYFGLSYREPIEDSYLIHLVYNALARRSNRSYVQSDTTPFQFDLSTRPTAMVDAKPTSHLIINADTTPAATLSAFEELLYGSDANDPRLPTPQQIVDLFNS